MHVKDQAFRGDIRDLRHTRCRRGSWLWRWQHGAASFGDSLAEEGRRLPREARDLFRDRAARLGRKRRPRRSSSTVRLSRGIFGEFHWSRSRSPVRATISRSTKARIRRGGSSMRSGRARARRRRPRPDGSRPPRWLRPAQRLIAALRSSAVPQDRTAAAPWRNHPEPGAWHREAAAKDSARTGPRAGTVTGD